ncbi:MAG TPA: hypothetical protein VGM90_24530 [Kofleriaceae bacterium]
MRILALAFVGALSVVACSGDDGSPAPIDSGSGSGSAAAFGGTCSTASDTSTECQSGVCTDSFEQLGIVCSVKCDAAGAGSECPSGSMGMKCNQKGYCRP